MCVCVHICVYTYIHVCIYMCACIYIFSPSVKRESHLESKDIVRLKTWDKKLAALLHVLLLFSSESCAHRKPPAVFQTIICYHPHT